MTARMLIAAALTLATVHFAHAQTCPGTWLPGQTVPGVSAGGMISTVLPLPDGSLFAVGAFDIAGSSRSNAVARFDPATQRWSGTISPYSRINDVVMLPGGDLLLGGQFSVNGTNNLARYRPSTGQWITPIQGPGGAQSGISNVRCFALRPDGTVVVGGNFLTVGSTQLRGIGLYNPATNSWTPFGTGVTHPVAAQVNSILRLSNGEIIIGGYFTTVNGMNAANIAKWSPVTNSWTTLGPGVGGAVSSLSLTPDGRLLVGGIFTTAGGSPANNIALYSFATSTWSSVGAGFGTPGNGAAAEAVALPGGDIIAVGYGTTSPTRSMLVSRYLASSGSWTTLAQPAYVGSSLYEEIRSATLMPDGSVTITGTFTSIGGISANSVARLDPATNTFSPLGAGNGDRITKLLMLPNEDLYAAGPFRSIGGTYAEGLAHFDRSTNTWSPVPNAPSGLVKSLTLLLDGDLILGGTFTTAGAQTVNNVVRYSPATQTYSPLGTGVSYLQATPIVNDVLSLPNGDLIVAGEFNTAGSSAVSNIARFRPSTGEWSAVGSGVPRVVLALAPLPNGLLAACTDGLYRYFNSNGIWLPASPINDFGGSVYAFAPLPNGDYLISGNFTQSTGWPAQRLARFNPSGNIITPVAGNLPIGEFYTMHVSGDELIAGGSFHQIPSYLGAPNIAKLNLTTGAWTLFGSGTNGPVDDLEVLSNGEVVAAGRFTLAGDQVSPYLARWVINSADFNNDGDAGADADIQAFFACLAGSCCPTCGTSDFNADGDSGTDADIEAFFRVLAGGAC